MPDADRVRLAAHVQADYDGYGYAPLLADDLRAVAGLAADVSAGAASSNAAVAAADADRIAAAGSAAAAAAIVSAVADLGTRWNYRSGVIIADWSSAPGAFTSTVDADWFGICSWGDLTANERMGIVVNPAHSSVEARIAQGGAAGTPSIVFMSAPAAGSTIRTAIAWDRDLSFLQVAARGTAGTKVALASLPAPGWIMPGRYATSHPLFGGMSGLEIRPAAQFDAALAALPEEHPSCQHGPL